RTAGPTLLLFIKQHLRMLLNDVQESIIHVVVAQRFHQFLDGIFFRTTEWLESMKDQPDVLPLLPVHRVSKMLNRCAERGQYLRFVLVVGYCLGEVGYAVQPIAGEDRRDPNHPFPATQPALPNVGTSEADN